MENQSLARSQDFYFQLTFANNTDICFPLSFVTSIMDRRRKNINLEAERVLRDTFYEDIASHSLSIANAVKAMRRLSRLTQVEFAKRQFAAQTTRRKPCGQPAKTTIDRPRQKNKTVSPDCRQTVDARFLR
jgi:hypothetical protein